MTKIKKFFRCAWCREKISLDKQEEIAGYVERKQTNRKKGYVGWVKEAVKGRYCDETCKHCHYFNRLIVYLNIKREYEYLQQMCQLSAVQKTRLYEMGIRPIKNWERT